MTRSGYDEKSALLLQMCLIVLSCPMRGLGEVVVREGGTNVTALCDLVQGLNGLPWEVIAPMKAMVFQNVTVASQSGMLVAIEVRKAYAAMKRVQLFDAPDAASNVSDAFESAKRAAVSCSADVESARSLLKHFYDVGHEALVNARLANSYLRTLLNAGSIECQGLRRAAQECDTRKRKRVTADSLRRDIQAAVPSIHNSSIIDCLVATHKLLEEAEGIATAVDNARRGAARQVPVARVAGAAAAFAATKGLVPPPAPSPPHRPSDPERSEKPFYVILLVSIILMTIFFLWLLAKLMMQLCEVCYHRKRISQARRMTGLDSIRPARWNQVLLVEDCPRRSQ
uniref:WGS project CAEQ00000000 data, annotated contig 2069 n=1 Tax=Trypanosoma congolense (strain IL3000) TaxID=1068625 RepID=F9WB68_TRYCI|nr:unnamed protein product [Trypanosoma congolense IL3000]